MIDNWSAWIICHTNRSLVFPVLSKAGLPIHSEQRHLILLLSLFLEHLVRMNKGTKVKSFTHRPKEMYLK